MSLILHFQRKLPHEPLLQTCVALLALAAVASAMPANPPPSYAPAPVHKPAPSYHEPAYKETPAKYEYKYGVDAQDGYKNYVQFGANEARDGYSTYGEYRVLLPDGRTQIVTYNTADAYSGNVMDVKYEGKASYAPHEPVHKAAPAPYHPAPVHKPAPSYKPAPVHKPAPSYHSAPAPVYHA